MINTNSLVIATRESPLALWQAKWVQQQLQKIYPTLSVTLLGLTTTADQTLNTTLQKIGGKGLFVKELEDALLNGQADIAVHSMKDVPMDLAPEFFIAAVCERDDPHDAFVSNDYQTLFELPAGAKVGTSSLRRQSQLAALRPDLQLVNLRGNINTRLLRLDAGEFAAIILAAAGLKRLGLNERIRSVLTIEQVLPAAGQGALAIECLASNQHVIDLMAPLNHAQTDACVTAERALCRRLGGGCQVPIGAFAELLNDHVKLRGLVGRPDGTLLLHAEHRGATQTVDALGVNVAEQLLEKGAANILDALRQNNDA